MLRLPWFGTPTGFWSVAASRGIFLPDSGSFRVGKEKKYIALESYRNESEMANLLYWQLTCQSFYNTEEWEWMYLDNGYTGDFGFIFFE